jgi:hypothetical protein
VQFESFANSESRIFEGLKPKDIALGLNLVFTGAIDRVSHRIGAITSAEDTVPRPRRGSLFPYIYRNLLEKICFRSLSNPR